MHTNRQWSLQWRRHTCIKQVCSNKIVETYNYARPSTTCNRAHEGSERVCTSSVDRLLDEWMQAAVRSNSAFRCRGYACACTRNQIHVQRCSLSLHTLARTRARHAQFTLGLSRSHMLTGTHNLGTQACTYLSPCVLPLPGGIARHS